MAEWPSRREYRLIGHAIVWPEVPTLAEALADPLLDRHLISVRDAWATNLQAAPAIAFNTHVSF